jgi:hypothetical protein
MPCIQKEAIAATPIIILLLYVHFCCRGHYFLFVSGDVNGVKVTEERQVWVPALWCQTV